MIRETDIERNIREKPKPTIRVCLVVQNRLLRETMVHVLQKKQGITVVGKEYCAERFPDSKAAEAFDVLLLDSLEPGCAKDLKGNLDGNSQRARAIFFGMDDDPERFLRAVRSGACGYLLKDASAEEIVSAVRKVAEGEAVCPPKLCMWLFDYVVREKIAHRGNAGRTNGGRLGLTHRQHQLMGLVAKGMTNKEIASKLNLSEFTVKNHISRVMKLLNADSRHEAANLIQADGSAEAPN